MLTATEADVERFLSFVEVLPCGCWFWTGARSRGKGNKKWYGSFKVKNKNSVRSHRFSDEVFNRRPCPKGHHRSHTCHFSLCVNPDHIVVTTREDNQDQIRQRRDTCRDLMAEFRRRTAAANAIATGIVIDDAHASVT